MGTRADFWIRHGAKAEWLGSVAFDGYKWYEQLPNAVMSATTPDEMRAAVAALGKDRKDFSSPADGWPWPWEDSCTTDYAYVLYRRRVKVYCFGRLVRSDGREGTKKVTWFPDMTARANVQMGGSKSGLLVVTIG